jgi:hypothetical protein
MLILGFIVFHFNILPPAFHPHLKPKAAETQHLYRLPRKKLSWSQFNNSHSKGSTCKIKLQYKTSHKLWTLLKCYNWMENMVFKINNQIFWIHPNALKPCAKHSTANKHITAHLVAESHLPLWSLIAQFILVSNNQHSLSTQCSEIDTLLLNSKVHKFQNNLPQVAK